MPPPFSLNLLYFPNKNVIPCPSRVAFKRQPPKNPFEPFIVFHLIRSSPPPPSMPDLDGDSYASQPSGSTPPAQEHPTAGAPSHTVPAEIPGLATPVLGEGPASHEIYTKHLIILRDIITV